MSKTTTIIFSILIPITIILISFGIFYIQSIKNIEVKNTEITDITDVSLDGFTIHADVYVYNPSIFRISAKRVDYSVSFNEYRSEGEIGKTTLRPRDMTIIKVSQRLDWHMSSEVAKNLITMKKTYATLEGDIIIMEKPILIKKHFSQQIELTEIVRNFIVEEVKEAVESVKQVVNNVVDTISDVGKDIVSGIKGLFD
ncbi:hypothetical protein JXA48_02085 [Candidatus Woesearchaeota archaeon]|nr:hypothetical protein [Candidatus Woesearchaeota archaeon]